MKPRYGLKTDDIIIQIIYSDGVIILVIFLTFIVLHSFQVIRLTLTKPCTHYVYYELPGIVSVNLHQYCVFHPLGSMCYDAKFVYKLSDRVLCICVVSSGRINNSPHYQYTGYYYPGMLLVNLARTTKSYQCTWHYSMAM
jgi:hypothetical protein